MILTRLKELREDSGYTKRDMAREFNVSESTYGKWELGKRKPDAETISGLARFFDVSSDYLLGNSDKHWPLDIIETPVQLREDEQRLLKRYNLLEDYNQIYAINLLSKLYKHQCELHEWSEAHRDSIDKLLKESFSGKEGNEDKFEKMVDFDVHCLPASAGTGVFLHSSEAETISVPEDILPYGSSFGIRISGDSMEPEFYDEDIAIVQPQPFVLPKEIGIFILNGEGFCKRLMSNIDGYYLESINPKYDPIILNEYGDLRIVGKVIGKLYDSE